MEREWTVYFSLAHNVESHLLPRKLRKLVYEGGLRKIEINDSLRFERKVTIGEKITRVIYHGGYLLPCIYKESTEELVSSSLFASLDPIDEIDRRYGIDTAGLRWSINKTSDESSLEIELERAVDVHTFIEMIFKSELVELLQLIRDPLSLQQLLSLDLNMARQFVYSTTNPIIWHALKLDGIKHVGFLMSDRLIVPYRNVTVEYNTKLVINGVAVVSVEELNGEFFIIDILYTISSPSYTFKVSISDAIDAMMNLSRAGVKTNKFVKRQDELEPDPAIAYDGRLEFTHTEIVKVKPSNTVDLLYVYKKKPSSFNDYFYFGPINTPVPPEWTVAPFALPTRNFQVVEFTLNVPRKKMYFQRYRSDKMIANTLVCFDNIVSCHDNTY